ncbi:entericidin [Pseudooceanicola lipolyticus]|uniref:Entericidin n=1 Tax=Pseudooceanicola lipolyticus TaxID=2029104 RepID=A0A2M8J0E9_9RHOB|nr:entericidin A/B family lipoprotein [Pseudooceanicola lipolyticus]PJE36234.1 entericidin [Pseudooceanicola lipolyticus]
MTLSRIALLFALLGGLAACEATEGLGRDVQTLGQNIEDEAEQAD